MQTAMDIDITTSLFLAYPNVLGLNVLQNTMNNTNKLNTSIPNDIITMSLSIS